MRTLVVSGGPSADPEPIDGAKLHAVARPAPTVVAPSARLDPRNVRLRIGDEGNPGDERYRQRFATPSVV